MSLEASEQCQGLTVRLLSAGGMSAPVTSTTCEPSWALHPGSVGLVCAEPYFHDDRYCKTWGRAGLLRYWLSVEALSPYLTESALLLPYCCRLHVALVQCSALWNARKPCPASVEGLDLQAINTLHSFDKTDSVQLWKHHFTALSAGTSTLFMNFYEPTVDAHSTTTTSVLATESGVCHAVVLWLEYSGAAGSRGATEPVVGESKWFDGGPPLGAGKEAAPYLQGIRYLREPLTVGAGDSIVVKTVLDVLQGVLTATVVPP